MEELQAVHYLTPPQRSDCDLPPIDAAILSAPLSPGAARPETQPPDRLPALAASYREQMRLYTRGIARLRPDMKVRPYLLFTACRELVAMDVGMSTTDTL